MISGESILASQPPQTPPLYFVSLLSILVFSNLCKQLTMELEGEVVVLKGECMGECGMGPNIETDEGKIINFVKGKEDIPPPNKK